MRTVPQFKKSTLTLFAAGIFLVGPQDLTSDINLDFTGRGIQVASGRPPSKQPLDFPFFIVDVETTGFRKSYDAIIEIAALRVDVQNDKWLFQEFRTLVKPPGNIPKSVRDLTGITNEMVQNSPNIETAIRELKSFVTDQQLVAHNASFDRRFLEANANLMGLTFAENEWICSLQTAKRAWPKRSKYSLESFASEYSGIDQTHRAMDDVWLTFQVYVNATEQLGGAIDLPPLTPPAPETDDEVKYDADLSGQVFVFTGFRDAVLAARIENCGGIVKGGISKKVTTLLVESIELSTGKVKKANAYNIVVETKSDFEKRFYC